MAPPCCKPCFDESIPPKKRLLWRALSCFCLVGVIVAIAIVVWQLTLPVDEIDPNTITEEETEYVLQKYNTTVNGTNGTLITYTVTEWVEVEVTYNYVWYIQSSNPYALRGHDAVEYFSLSSSDNAVEGSIEFQTEWQGVNWTFKDEANLNLFKLSPTDYAPRYGGYCAYAMANGYFASGDPDAWTIYGGYLYINANKNVRDTWSNNKNRNVRDADDNWGSGDFENDNWDSDLEA